MILSVKHTQLINNAGTWIEPRSQFPPLPAWRPRPWVKPCSRSFPAADSGTDGHTCSLFAAMPCCQSSPRLPSTLWPTSQTHTNPAERVTLTLPVVIAAACTNWARRSPPHPSICPPGWSSQGKENCIGSLTRPQLLSLTCDLIHCFNQFKTREW